MALKVLVLLWCLAWVCEGGAPGRAEKDKLTSVSEAVAIAEEEGTVEEGLRDKRYYSSFPPAPFHPSYYPNFTPEEWEAMSWRDGRGRSDAPFSGTTRSRVPDRVDMSSSFYRGGYTPYAAWYHRRQYPYYPYTRWFPGPHPFPTFTSRGHYDGYCNYPYPHSHPISGAFAGGNQAFPGDNRGQFGQGNQGFTGTQSGQGFPGGDNRGQFGQGNQGFTGTQSGQGFPGDERGSQGFSGSTGGQQGFTGDSSQGIPGDDRDQQGFPDQTQSGFGNFPHGARPSQGGQFGTASGSRSENFPGSEGPGEHGVRPSGGFPGARPGSFPSNKGDDSSSFNQGSSGGSFNQGGPGGSFGQGSPGSSFGQGSPGGSSNQGGPGGSFSPGSPGSSFNQGGHGSSFDQGGLGGSFGTGPDSIPMNFGSGGPGSPDPPSNFGQGGGGSSNSGPSGFTSITLSSSSNLVGSQSSSSNTRASSLGSPGGFQGLGSSSAARFSGFGNDVRMRDTQKAAMDPKNNIKRATPAAIDAVADSLPSSTA